MALVRRDEPAIRQLSWEGRFAAWQKWKVSLKWFI
jgi:hypothetical protein